LKIIPCMSSHAITTCKPILTKVKFKCYIDSNKHVTKFEFEGLNGAPRLILLTFEELKKRIRAGSK